MTQLARKGLWGAVLLLGACAHVSSAPRPVAATRLKLAALPVESGHFPAVASALNAALSTARVGGIDDYFLSRVTLEVVQLSIECVDASDACYSAVGRSLGANRLLLAKVGGGAHRHDRSIHVKVTLFDVDAGVPRRVAEQLFANRDLALGGVRALVDRVTAKNGRPE